MSSRDDVRAKLRDMVCELLVLEPDEVRPESLLLDDLDADSITFLELSFAIEKEFGVVLPELKADEETLSMPMPEGLRRLEAMPGGATLFEFVKQEVIRNMSTSGSGVRLEGAARDRLFESQTIATLARAVGARVPADLAPDAPVSSLRTRDLFRFLTVGTMAGYIEFLMAGGTSTP
jgi:acyl carrier protein